MTTCVHLKHRYTLIHLYIIYGILNFFRVGPRELVYYTSAWVWAATSIQEEIVLPGQTTFMIHFPSGVHARQQRALRQTRWVIVPVVKLSKLMPENLLLQWVNVGCAGQFNLGLLCNNYISHLVTTQYYLHYIFIRFIFLVEDVR